MTDEHNQNNGFDPENGNGAEEQIQHQSDDNGTKEIDKISEGETLYRIKFVHFSETELAVAPSEESYERNDFAIAESKYGKDLARILGKVESAESWNSEEILSISRTATEEDLNQFDENKEKEKEAEEICAQKIKEHNLDMKLVSAHYLLEEPKILFFFTADARVDFRALVKDLVSIFKKRIELRQIGVRDEARVCGGIGVCGRELCCHGLTDKLTPVSIKMAKEQNLSLNSMKISGPCGRLLCCLSYEYDFYHNERKKVPSEGTRIYSNGYSYRVMDVNLLKRTVTLTSEEGGVMEIPISEFNFNNAKGAWEAVNLANYL